MILIDYYAVAIGNVLAHKSDVEEALIRHTILNSVRMYRSMFHKEFGEIVICCDGWDNWRKEYFPNYKAKRKEKREESSTDWNALFDVVNKVKQEIKENFPYKVVDVSECEADDVIAQLVYETQEFGKFENVMIVSSDKDFAQLHQFSNVSQYSPLKKQVIKENNPRAYLLEHVLRGDVSDGVPNVLSDDNCFVEGRRQNPMRAKFVDDILNSGTTYLTEQNPEFVRNFTRNSTLIDLSKCPEGIKEKIINNYNEQDPTDNKQKVLSYLIEKRCSNLIESIGDFIND